ncbi:MAG: dTMP kinase [Anaerolineae bacterium]|jgi:dTMP kinase|nr:MAG: dTMP kinase [Anaerolineae bacterium]
MLITLEGPDGSGKSTQIDLLVQKLRAKGYKVVQTREPGGTSIGDEIRQVLHDLKNTAMHPHTETLLYAASRAQLVAQVIRPHLESGGIVVCDRYRDSTLAYQGYGHGLDLEALNSILAFATGNLTPDLTFYLDLSVEDGLKRRKDAADDWNRMDAMAVEFHQRVRAGYEKLIAAEPERWVRIDASQDIETIHQAILAVVLMRVKEMQK